jgi:hypothetical protein
MTGLIVVFGSILAGSLIAQLDQASGVILIVIGGICGCVITWIELS